MPSHLFQTPLQRDEPLPEDIVTGKKSLLTAGTWKDLRQCCRKQSEHAMKPKGKEAGIGQKEFQMIWLMHIARVAHWIQ